jgi:2'-5' RNA ligase
MKRYVIVCLIKGKAQEFHERLVKDVCNNFKVSPQKLPMHITLKAPFEIDDIKPIEKITEDFCMKNLSSTIDIKGFGYFRNNVIFMDVKPSKKTIELHNRYIELLEKVPNLQWSKNEGKERKFHCTIVSKRISEKFDEILKYVCDNTVNFHCDFDNISIMEYNHTLYKWELYKCFSLKNP